MGDCPALQRPRNQSGPAYRRGRRPRLRHRGRRGAVRPGAVPARLDAGRRHRRGERPPGRRHRARPLAARPAPRAVALAVRQARRGRTPRLDRARRARRRRHPLGQVPPGGRDPHARGDPLRDLRDAALAGPPGEAVAARPDRRLARGLARRGRSPRLSRVHPVRRGARYGERGGLEGQPGRGRTVAAGPRGPTPPARAPRCAHRLRVGDRRHHAARARLCRQARALGRRRDAVRDPHRVRLRDGGGRRRGARSRREGPEGAGALSGPRALL